MARIALLVTFVCVPLSISAQGLVFHYIAPNEVIEYETPSGDASAAVGILIAEDDGNPNFPNNVVGWSMSHMLDSPFLEVSLVEEGEYLQSIADGDGPEFFAATVLPDGFTVACVYSLIGGITCTYEVPKEALKVTVETNPENLAGNSEGATVPMTWMDGLGDPPVDNTFAPIAVIEFTDGSIDLVPLDPVASFVRGDCNDDTVVDIADGIWTLNAIFQGGDFGGCLEACDTNDDAALDVVDAIYNFNYRFSDGPQPPAPFPDCGLEPEADCTTSSCP